MNKANLCLIILAIFLFALYSFAMIVAGIEYEQLTNTSNKIRIDSIYTNKEGVVIIYYNDSLSVMTVLDKESIKKFK